AFPHDTTFDQFFGEAQFESYRALGSFTMMELGRRVDFAATCPAEKPDNMAHFFEKARKKLGDCGTEEDLKQPALRFLQLCETHPISGNYRLNVQPAAGSDAKHIKPMLDAVERDRAMLKDTLPDTLAGKKAQEPIPQEE